MKKGENMPSLKIAEIVLVNCNIFNSDYQDNSKFCIHLLPIKVWSLVKYCT